jgi:hypothetical protein
MSSILKALKRLEAENAARRCDPYRIDAEILRTPAPPRISLLSIALAAVLLFVCGGTATYVYMNRVRSALPLPSRETLPRSAASAPPHHPVRGAAAAVPPHASGVVERRPVASLTDGEGKSRRPSDDLSRRQRASFIPATVKSEREQAVPEKRGQVSHAVPASSTPTLRVDGIAFQDGADGVAVVNGVPVAKGASVGGAMVDEVQRDRVLFSRGGKKIEVLMGRSNR